MRVVPKTRMRTGDTFSADDMNRYEESLDEMLTKAGSRRFIHSFFKINLKGLDSADVLAQREFRIKSNFAYTILRVDTYLDHVAATHTLTIDNDGVTTDYYKQWTLATTGVNSWAESSEDMDVAITASTTARFRWSADTGVVANGYMIVHIVSDRLLSTGSAPSHPPMSNFVSGDVPDGDAYADILTDWEETAALYNDREIGGCILHVQTTPNVEPAADDEGTLYIPAAGIGFFYMHQAIVAPSLSGVMTATLYSPGAVTETSDSVTPGGTSAAVAATEDLYTSDTVVQASQASHDTAYDWVLTTLRASPGTAPSLYNLSLSTF